MNTVDTPRPMAIATKKRIPNTNESAFIRIASKIKDGRARDRQEISASLSGVWQEIAIELFDAYEDDGTEAFWTVYDALEVGNNLLRDWRELVRVPAAPDEQQAIEQQDKRFTKSADGKQLLKLSSIEDIYNIADAEYLIHKILEESGVSLLYGTSGTGKTFTALDMALSIAHGLYWHGRRTKEGVVLFINTEGGRGLKKRLKAWYIEHDNLSPTPNFKIIPWALDIRENIQALIDTLAEMKDKPVLVVFDNFSMCVPSVDQNKQEQVAPVLRDLHMIADEYGSHLMLIHHTNKDGDFNGTMAFRNHVDVMIELRKEDKADKSSPIVFTSQKSRDDDNFSPIRTELKSVNLYYDEINQDFVTSCVTVACDTPMPEKTTPETQTQAMSILNAHGQLNCSQWQKHCSDTYQISQASFYRVRDKLVTQEYVSPVGEKKNGSKLFYTLTESGMSVLSKPLSPLS